MKRSPGVEFVWSGSVYVEPGDALFLKQAQRIVTEQFLMTKYCREKKKTGFKCFDVFFHIWAFISMTNVYEQVKLSLVRGLFFPHYMVRVKLEYVFSTTHGLYLQ